MPAPAAALNVLLPIYLNTIFPIPHIVPIAGLISAYVVFIAFMMVSTIPTFSGKTIGTRVPRETVIPLSVGFVLLVAALISYPMQILALASIAYLAYIPLGWRRYRRLKRVSLAANLPSTTMPT
jgi:CDP-diacylglycerol--serine O-phosphatidyltransferase